MVFFLLTLLIYIINSLDNGLGLKPQMGYNSWYDTGCELNETVIRETATIIKSLELDKYGYTYINMDDCWAAGRYSNGTVYPSTPQFNITLKPLSDYIHSLGLKFGVYTDRGTKTCAGRPGSYGYELIDAQTYALWGVDYLKEDSCNASNDILIAYSEYVKMRDALNSVSHPIFFSLCGWNQWYGSVGASIGNSWRIGPDDGNWNNILTNIDINMKYSLYKYSGVGAWNDPCLLVTSNINSHAHITLQQSKIQFSMWTIMNSPLLISGNIRTMSQENINIYKNKYLIDVNQDTFAKQGIRIYGNDLYNTTTKTPDKYGVNIWFKQVVDGSRILLFVNVGENMQNITCNVECFENIGFYYGLQVKIYDLWDDNKYLGIFPTNQSLTVQNVESDGVAVYKLTPYYDQYPSNKLSTIIDYKKS